jgi:DNA-binding LacI/PurR family transcriptional regulator
MRMAPTLREVARRAGVSVATAHRVATSSAGVRAETRARVERAMRELLYVPSERSSQAETGLMGILVPELSNPIFPALAQAIEHRATPSGFASILCNTHEAAFREIDYVHMLLDRRVEGMIFVSCEMTNLRGEHGHYAQLVAEGARIVFVNGAVHTVDVPSVGVDERAAGELATQHLLDLGHTRIGFVAGPDHYLPTQLKSAGRAAALSAAGLTEDGLVAYSDFSLEGGCRGIAELLERPDPPTAVICSSDVMAIGVLHEAARRGLRVPDDLSVVGFDGIEATRWSVPELTTVEQPIDQIAASAVQTLQLLIAQPEAPLPNSYYRPTLRVRASTAARAAAPVRAAAAGR